MILTQEHSVAPDAQSRLPSVSVVIRSYKRLPSLLEILAALRTQDHPDYEVVVVEQSDFTPHERALVNEFAAASRRFRIVYTPPLGVGGAREAGWRLARKEIVLFIDDDDLPLGTDFVSGHAANYRDESIIAVTGRHVYSPNERCGYGLRWRARMQCLSYNLIGYPHAFCRFDERLESVQWVHGSNGSVRKCVIERVGGWDARSANHDEHPFCLRLLNMLKPGERLIFDPTIRLLRRKDIPGGAAARYAGPERVFRDWIAYYHGPVMKNRTMRILCLYPLIPIATTFSTARWIWTDAEIYDSSIERLVVTLKTLACSPYWYLRDASTLAKTSLNSTIRGPQA